jgi:metallo-beta-lactamase class B
VLETDQGLILFDAFSNSVEASRYITGDMRQLGLDPKQIRYVVITHGHWDHFGGAGFLQTRYGARVLMGEADWDAVTTADPWGTELEGQRPPNRDIAVTDKPMDLTLGKTTVKLLLTPGHSPGTVSALIPAKNGSTTHWLAMWGGNAIPGNVEPSDPKNTASWRNLGLRRMNESVRKFRDWAIENGAEGVIGTHTAEDATTRFPALKLRKSGNSHPFILGKELTHSYFTALDHCMQGRMIQAANRK